ncbi:hypothetical protein YC2023_072603 [Brassica napus]
MSKCVVIEIKEPESAASAGDRHSRYVPFRSFQKYSQVLRIALFAFDTPRLASVLSKTFSVNRHNNAVSFFSLENILNYVLERVWTISYIKGSGRVKYQQTIKINHDDYIPIIYPIHIK